MATRASRPTSTTQMMTCAQTGTPRRRSAGAAIVLSVIGYSEHQLNSSSAINPPRVSVLAVLQFLFDPPDVLVLRGGSWRFRGPGRGRWVPPTAHGAQQQDRAGEDDHRRQHVHQPVEAGAGRFRQHARPVLLDEILLNAVLA